MWLLLVGIALAAPCKNKDLDDLVEALRSVRDERVVELTAFGLNEACELGSLNDVLQSISQAPPDYRPMLVAKGISEAPDAWNAGCDGGLDAVIKTGQAAPSDKREVLWDACGLEGRGLFTQAEWDEAPGLLYAPVLFHGALLDAKVPEDTARAVVRGLTGYSLRVQPRVVDEFVPLLPEE